MRAIYLLSFKIQHNSKANHIPTGQTLTRISGIYQKKIGVAPPFFIDISFYLFTSMPIQAPCLHFGSIVLVNQFYE
ncbi:MAG: hypothetical protein V4495_29835 [Pseudomonadota bacterium]